MSVILISFFLLVPAARAGEAAAAVPDAKTKAVSALPSYPKTTTQIVVTVSVNTVSKGDFFVELDDEGNLFIKTEDLDTLNLKFSGDRVVLIHDERYVPAGAVLDVTSAFDEKKLVLSFIGRTTEAQKTSLDVFSLQPKPKNVYYPRETSAFLNYGLTYAYTDPLGFQSFSATNKVGAHAGDVFFTSDSLYTKNKTDENFVRLQSSATYERRGELQWLVLGDQFANSGDLGSSVNIGGLGFSKIYKLDPYFITQPAFDLTGSVIYPTQAEIYMDHVLVGRQQIAPGTFDLRNIYSYTGQHNVEVVLKDPFGNEQRISYPLYFSTQLLREGLQEYSYNAGFLREDYGVRSDEYGRAAFSAFHRYGVTSSFNIGARAEGSDGVYNGGLFTAFALPHTGVFTLSFAESSAHSAQGEHGEHGHAGALQHTYQLGSFSTNISLRAYSRDYATVAAPPSADMTRYAASGAVGFTLPIGGISLGYSGTETYSGKNMRLTSANYSRSISKTVSFFTTASETRQTGQTGQGRAKDYSIFVGLNFNFDNNTHGALQYTKTTSVDTETAQIQKDVPVGEGFGYRANLNRSAAAGTNTNSFSPFVQYNGRYGIYTLDSSIQNSAGKTTEAYNLSTAGSLVYAGGFFGASRPVSDSFSIVMMDKVANAKVLNNGQEIGTTGSSGNMVVPTLTSYGQNQISVDVKNLPMDYSISGVSKALSPSLWSGSCVAFDAVRMQAVTGSLFVKVGDKKIPMEYVDISLKVGEKEVTSPTGKVGEFYIENTLPKEAIEGAEPDQLSCRAIAERRKTGGKVIQPGVYTASVDYADQKCVFNITFPETDEVITDLGQVVCELQKASVQTRPIAVPKKEVRPPVVPAPALAEKPAPQAATQKGPVRAATPPVPSPVPPAAARARIQPPPAPEHPNIPSKEARTLVIVVRPQINLDVPIEAGRRPYTSALAGDLNVLLVKCDGETKSVYTNVGDDIVKNVCSAQGA
ncbi:MAG TPA: fimbria/pilus outer membrane usher protein, partial [Nitrospirota bacterium]|nr:fimbria/pilus outer membrane usher protein [Nitrospirota bacterium]